MDNDNTPDQPDPTPDPAPIAPPAAPAAPAAHPVPPAPPQMRWRDRAFRFRAVLAVALASVILGAGAGVLGSLAFGHDQDGPDRQHRIEGPGRGDFPGQRGPGGGQNMPQPGTDQLPPGTAPQQDESEPSAQDDATSAS